MNTLAIFSDTHCNHTTGLAKPIVDIGDGDQSSGSFVRRWLYGRFVEMLEEIDKKKQGELTSVFNGDTVDGDMKNRSAQVISRQASEITAMAQAVLEPVFQMSERVYVIRGTEAHVGLNGDLEELFASGFDNTVQNPETKKNTWWWLPLEFSGVTIDIAHHPQGGGGGRPFNYHSVVDRLASDTLFRYANTGKKPPQLVIRSHLHGYRDSRDRFATRAIVTPALSLMTAYTHRIGLTEPNKVGCILIYCDNGQYEVEPIMREPLEDEWQVIQ